LRKSEAELNSIFRAAPVGIGVVSDRILLSRKRTDLCNDSGNSPVELIGKNARILYPADEDYEYVGKVKYDLMREKGIGTVNTRWKCKDGSIIDILLSSTPIDLSDIRSGVMFTALDITDLEKCRHPAVDPISVHSFYPGLTCNLCVTFTSA